jgi:hypothetical protein
MRYGRSGVRIREDSSEGMGGQVWGSGRTGMRYVRSGLRIREDRNEVWKVRCEDQGRQAWGSGRTGVTVTEAKWEKLSLKEGHGDRLQWTGRLDEGHLCHNGDKGSKRKAEGRQSQIRETKSGTGERYGTVRRQARVREARWGTEMLA